MERVAVTAGTALGGRYQVQRPAWTSSLGEAYVGRDTVLDRAVLVFPLPFDDPERVGAFAQIHHPGLLQIYDAGPGWMVCEYPSGGRLAERLAKGALSLGDAARAIRDVARALTALHTSGVAHGAIGPDVVVFDEEGRAKLAGAAFDRERPATTADDDAALGRLAWLAFTGTEPGTAPPAARLPGRMAAAAGRTPKLPPPVGELLRRMISSDPVLRPRLREIDEVLAPYARIAPPEPKPSFLRTEARWLVPVLLLVGLGAAAVAVGVRVDFGRGGSPDGTPNPPTQGTPTPLAFASVTTFDPPPRGNAEENDQVVARAHDGKDVSYWFSKGYRSAAFGREKAGVGLLFDLGSSRRVSRIVIKTPLEGWKAEWRAAETRGSSADDYQVRTAFTASSNDVVVPIPTGSGRYWLLWVTQLAPADSGDPRFPFQVQVAEVHFFA